MSLGIVGYYVLAIAFLAGCDASPVAQSADEQQAKSELADSLPPNVPLNSQPNSGSSKAGAQANLETELSSTLPSLADHETVGQVVGVETEESSETNAPNNAEVDFAKISTDGYTDAQLSKNSTLLMLAYEPDLRARHLMKHIRQYLTPEQQAQGLKLLLKHDHEFEAVKTKRADILNAAVDADETKAKLRNLKVEIVEISARLRHLVNDEFMTPKQKDARAQQGVENRKNKAIELKRRQAKIQSKKLVR